MPELSNPYQARDHARSMHGTLIDAMPTLPISAAGNLPADIDPATLIWDETFAAGDYGSRVLKRGTRLQLIDTQGDACCQLLVHNAARPFERLNVADTVKVQWNAYLGEGKLLLSDMGRVLMSIVRDTSGRQDTFCGASTAWSNAKRYGDGANHSKYPNARDRFLLSLLKHGLGKKDIPPNISFFKSVKIAEDGSLTFVGATPASPVERQPAPAGDAGVAPTHTYIELRAEIDVLVSFANCPHVLDPRPAYTASPLRALAWQGSPTPADDPIRNATPENQRAFENVDDYLR